MGSGVSLVVVYTDHNPLTFLCLLSCPIRRLMRWTIFLQSHELDIRHIRVKDKVVADAPCVSFSTLHNVNIYHIYDLIWLDLV